MRIEVSVLLTAGAILALPALFPIASLAADGGAPAGQEGEGRWVPSLAITSGITVQKQHGFADSVLFEDGNPVPVSLRGPVDGDDLAVSPFVGGSLEVMTPALPIPTRPRLFLSGEVVPTFASDRDLAVEGDPSCARGPDPDAPCARDEEPGSRDVPFGEDSANGTGTTTSAQIDTLVFGASMGVAFPFQIAERRLRIKPSAGWIHYKVDAEGFAVDARCNPVNRCTDVTSAIGVVQPGFLRETILMGSASQTFNGIGPGLDIEMDVGRYGPLGVSLFLGGRAYRVLGDRTIEFGASQSFNDVFGMDVAVAEFEVEVDPWLYRAHLGIRFQWLGSPD